MDIPFSRPFVGKEEEEAVLRVLRSGWLTTGKEALAFEEEFSRFLSGAPAGGGAKPGAAPPCLAVNSATSGLHLALEACGVTAGDLVLLPSYTFTSSAEVVRYLGAQPVFVDVGPESFHLDGEALETTLKRLSRGLSPYPSRGNGEGSGPRGRAAAVMPVHYGGLPCGDMAAILDTARRYGLRVVEDAAHSFPSYCTPAGTGSPAEAAGYAGTLGDAGVFSFYATKTISTGEGGMVACGDPELAKRISLMRSHGIDRSIWNRYTDSKASWYYQVLEPGFKYNLPDLLAAIGRVQLGRAWELLNMRREIAAAYDGAFSGDPHFAVPPTSPADARHLYPLRLNPETLRIGRDEFAAKLQEGGVGISVHFIPLHTMPYYRKAHNLEPEDLPRSMASFRREISLPIWPGMDKAMTERVIELARDTAARYSA
ncbi:MAG: DegT/DnrJ/EryC1/StrS aminotransferase family protein [Treponema sp.]|jgi:dTDP-4-amino-4,6-dideoxygalactose transaminase|nr:DegT/DnrJ/EryC1/StrS aminotransferase family protein [Treponema sp.]